jgi:hypothetical protein
MRLTKSIWLLIALTAAAPAIANEYCDGYKQGYKEGYAQTAGAEPTPMSPLCPMKPKGNYDARKSDYELGYQKGLKDGIRDGSR